MAKVVVTDYLSVSLDLERRVLANVATVEALTVSKEEDLFGRIEDADAVMMYHVMSMSSATLGRLRHCKMIVRCGVGVDNIDLAAARRLGIPVANVPDYGTEEVADSAVGMALALARGIAHANSRLRAEANSWCHKPMAPLQRLRGRVFGIVGLGRIGTATALRSRALGMQVMYYDPHKPDGYDKALGIRRVDTLGELLGQAYVLSLHCPLTDETRHMIDAAALAQMPRGSYLVNTARGMVVDTAAIPPAITSGQLAGAGIDVLPVEPPLEDDPLVAAWRNPDHLAHHRVLINPHVAFYCEQGLVDVRIKAAETCRLAILGKSLRNVVN